MTHSKTIVPLLAAALCLSGCELMEPREDPRAQQLADLDRRLAALERILAGGSLVELAVQADELERQTAELQGRIESLEYNAEGTASRQRDLYVDLDDRIQQLERSLQARAAGNVTAVAEPGQLLVPGGNDRENYEAAFNLLKAQEYEAAGSAFAQFLATFPDSVLADNAQYWLAESYYVRDEFEEALAQFRVVISGYPRSRKLPDAWLKIGYSNYELGRFDAAREALARVQAEFADTTAARLAEQRLKRMDDEGH